MMRTLNIWLIFSGAIEGAPVPAPSSPALGMSRSSVEPNITVGEYAHRWLTVIAASLKPRTVESYATNLDVRLLPRFQAVRVRNLQRGPIKSFLGDKVQAGPRSA